MAWAADPIDLTEGKIRIKTYGIEDCDGIAAAVYNPTGWFEKNWRLGSIDEISAMQRGHVEAHGRGVCNPFIYTIDGEIAGITRFHRMDAKAKTLEIGGTWVAPKWKRTFVNTSVKKALMGYAFDVLGAHRVEFRVNSNNFTSQMSVLRIGAKFEGTLRGALTYTGSDLQDWRLYSVTKLDWPDTQDRLNRLLTRQATECEFLPHRLDSSRFTLKVYELCDTQTLLDSIHRNRQTLLQSFPQSAAMRTEEEARAFIAEKAHLAASGSAFFYGAWERESKRLVGQLQIKNIDWKLRSAELGYYVDGEMRRKGFASEFVTVGVNLLKRHNFRRIYARVITGNDASLATCHKLGLQSEGVMRSAFLGGDGRIEDVTLLAWG